MKTIIALSVFMLTGTSLVAQSPILSLPLRAKSRRDTSAIMTIRRAQDTLSRATILSVTVPSRSEEDTREPELLNGVWTSASVAYNFASSGKGDKLNVVAQAALNAWRPDWKPLGYQFAVPIIGNLAKPTTGSESAEELKANAQELMGSAQGIYAGIAPTLYRLLGDRGYAVRFYGSASVRTNSVKDLRADTTFQLTHARFSVGTAFTLAQFEQGKGSVSVELYNSRFGKSNYARAFDSGKPHIWNTELVAILPIASNVGILAQYLRDFTNKESSWRMGVALQPQK